MGAGLRRIVRRPIATLVAGLIVFGALAVASAGYVASGFGGAVTAPAGTDSALGNVLLARHFPQTAANPTIIVMRLPRPAWAQAASVAAAERQLADDPQFTAVSGPLDANGTALTAAQYTALHAAYGPPRALGTALAATVPRAERAAYQSYRASGVYVSADGYTISFATVAGGGQPDHHRGLAGGARRPRRRRAGGPGRRRRRLPASPGRPHSPTTSGSCPTATCGRSSRSPSRSSRCCWRW